MRSTKAKCSKTHICLTSPGHSPLTDCNPRGVLKPFPVIESVHIPDPNVCTVRDNRDFKQQLQDQAVKKKRKEKEQQHI